MYEIRIVGFVTDIQGKPGGECEPVIAGDRKGCHWSDVDAVDAARLGTVPPVGLMTNTRLHGHGDVAGKANCRCDVDKFGLEIDVAERGGFAFKVPDRKSTRLNSSH